MLLHNFKYAFRVLFRDKMLIFWTYAFPIILGTFFWLAFSNIENSEQLGIVDIAVVENQAFTESELWTEALARLGEDGSDEQLFSIRYTSEEEAKKLLTEKKITGYVLFSEENLEKNSEENSEENSEKDSEKRSEREPQIVLAANGIKETVLQYAVGEIAQTGELMQQVAEYQMQQNVMAGAGMSENFFEDLYHKILEETQKETGIRDVSTGNLSYTMIEFYTLIAMTCLYGGMLGMTAVNQSLANMSAKGKRVSIGPTKKGWIVLGSTLASYVTQLIGIALLFAYTILVLHVDYGSRLPLIVLLTLIGCLAGLALGIAVAVLVKSSENTKTGVILSVTLFGCFLSGMMGITMKYLIDKHIPLLNRLNPANMITDGLYALYYYDTLDRYWLDVGSLLIFAGILLLVSISGLRRQKYDSI